jgi:RND family efflux transporter MFP subunit
MKRFYILALIAILGLGIAISASIYSNKPVSQHSQAILPFKPPYKSYVVGAGIVEASTGNIAIGTPVSGIVMNIYVKVGDQVEAGDPLFKIDDRDLQARLLTARARVKEATAALKKPKQALELNKKVKKADPEAISEQDFLDLTADTAKAEAALELAKAQQAQIEREIEIHTIRALVTGEILQLKMHLGEFVEGSSFSSPLLVLGGAKRMNLRVDVDEHDAWGIKPNAEAMAFVQGHPELNVPLQFEYTEPFMVPKKSLTGQSTERTDTRVLQVIYSFEPKEIPVYIGQQLDVFIQTLSSKDKE